MRNFQKKRMHSGNAFVDDSENGKVTMVEWNNAWQKFTRSMDVYITIDTIQQSGNTAEYRSVNVMDH